jgi:hypothetical protein
LKIVPIALAFAVLATGCANAVLVKRTFSPEQGGVVKIWGTADNDDAFVVMNDYCKPRRAHVLDETEKGRSTFFSFTCVERSSDHGSGSKAERWNN